MKKSHQIFLIGFVFLGIGIAAGYFLSYYYQQEILIEKFSNLRPIREGNPSYQFINPLLAYIIPSSDKEPKLSALKSSIAGVIHAQKKHGLDDASVFMSDLNRGRWIGVAENEEYPPASMFKVVVMTAYFKGSEEIPGLFSERVTYTKEVDETVRKAAFQSSTNLRVGSSYTIKELIDRMIIDSDNGAEILLLGYMNKDFFSFFYDALDIKGPNADGSFMVSPRSYSLFFRILYSATYLNKDSSEKALQLLSKTTFNDGIVAGLPKEVKVAHKFGEYVAYEGNTVEEIHLHDCGIVYYLQDPYLLCVMTKGNNLEILKNTIQKISSMVYQAHSY